MPRAAQPLFLQQGRRFLPRAAAVFTRGGRSAHRRDASLADPGQRFARPGSGHGGGEAVAVVERRGAVDEVGGRGSEPSNGDHLARAQAHAASAHPAQAVTAGGVAPGQSAPLTRRFDPPARESAPPVEDGVGTRGLRHAACRPQESQDATDGAKAAAHHEKAGPAAPNDLDLRPHGHGLRVALKLAQAAWGRFEGLRGLITLGCDAGEVLAQVTVVIAALLGCGFPWVAAVWHLGTLTHRRRSRTSPHGASAWGGGGCTGQAQRGESDERCGAPGARPRDMSAPGPRTRRAHDVQPHGSHTDSRRAWSVRWRCHRAAGQNTVL